jgi:L-lactate dehydrogenase (cytochrome)
MTSRRIERQLNRLLCLDDFEDAARRFLPRPIFGYVAGAAETNRSLDMNRSAFQRYNFVPRVLVNVSQRNQSISLFGKTYSSPFGIAPTGMAALYAYRGDIRLAQAAEAASIPMIMSGSSLIRMEDVRAVSKSAWFQAYLPGDDDGILKLVERVEATGFETLVITVDTPVGANRENNVRAGFSSPLRPSLRLAMDGITHPRWLFGTFLKTIAKHGIPHFENSFATRGAPIISSNVERDFSGRGHLTWRHFEMIRAKWPGKLVIKGVLAADDAKIACAAGADGIIVSNHGGRQLDGTVAPFGALPYVVDAAGGTVPVMLDSGVRRGTDVVKALALGAKCVFVGRPFAYAATIGGQAGVKRAITLLAEEISRDMGMLGVTSIDALGPSCLVRASEA